MKYNDEQIINLHSKGLTDREIAEKIGAKINAFATKRRKLGLKPNKSKRELHELSSLETEILVGTLLGDSCVRYVYKGCKYPNLTFCHCPEQEEYFKWKADKLVNLKSSSNLYNNNYIKKNGLTNKRLIFTGSNMPCLEHIRKVFYPNGIKIIPIKFLKNTFTELSLYCLFMDDGSYDKNGNSYIINTQCFSKENLQEFVILLKEKFNLDFSIKSDNSLYLKHSSNKIMQNLLIRNNECESMSYKCGASCQ